MAEHEGNPRVDRVLPAPAPVWVHIGLTLTDSLGGDRRWWLRREGLQVSADPVPGQLTRWVRSSGGGWLGVCDLVVSSVNGRVVVELRQLVPARYITPR
ncbi:MAG: hypothetical protein ACRDXX_10895 [Stackebrandtia sp.]